MKSDIRKQNFHPSLNSQEFWESSMQPLLLLEYLYKVYSLSSHKGLISWPHTLSSLEEMLMLLKLYFAISQIITACKVKIFSRGKKRMKEILNSKL